MSLADTSRFTRRSEVQGTWFRALGAWPCVFQRFGLGLVTPSSWPKVRGTAACTKSYDRLGCHQVRLTPLLSVLI